MSVDVQVCRTCSTRWFPHRLLCPSCGGSSLAPTHEEVGVVEESTTLAGGVVVATVRVGPDVRLVARLHGAAPPGSTVPVTHDPADERRPRAHVPHPDYREKTTHE